jgi:hypothetical protein
LVPDPYIHFFTLTTYYKKNSFKVVTIYHTDWLYVPTFTSLYVVTIPYRPLQAHMANTCCPQAFRDRLTRFLVRGRWDEDQVSSWDILHGSNIIVLQEGTNPKWRSCGGDPVVGILLEEDPVVGIRIEETV